MLPLTIRQQKFSKLQALMNPEIQAIQAKYKNKKDNESMMAMQAETKAVYAKYGTSPSGSCLQLLIQMPILFALYRVIYSLPAYITTLKDHFTVLADNAISRGIIDKGVDGLNAIRDLQTSQTHLANFDIEGNQVNAVIDCLNSMNHDTLNSYFASQPECADSLQKINDYNSFLGMNLTNSPMQMLSEAWNNPSGIKWGLLIGAILIPLLAGATQWINTKLMPQPANNNSTNPNDPGASMGQSLKVMNNIMPIMS
ncbi:MAG: YidC/Oxa1 family membrane protein insertase, partial [Clostridium sp.]|nr:YidC/Oxa1 family membrane protein insertase [Clostridium sp.]